jgi:hypothetical protein
MTYFSADFSLCEKSRIFFSYLGSISSHIYNILCGRNNIAINIIVCTTYTFSTYGNKLTKYWKRGLRTSIIQDVEKKVNCSSAHIHRDTCKCLPDTFRQSQVAGKSAKKDLLINLSKSSFFNRRFESDNTCAWVPVLTVSAGVGVRTLWPLLYSVFATRHPFRRCKK